jgi:hypothetical protein
MLIKNLLTEFFGKKDGQMNENTELGDCGFTDDMAKDIKTVIFNEYGVQLSCDLFTSTTVKEIIENFNKEIGNDIDATELAKITRRG